jgi:ParB-like chromosome segregation protein Spo0J
VTDVVIDFHDAKKRLKSQEKVWPPAPIQKTLALAEEFRRHLDAGGVNQSGLARRHGLTRARVTQVLNLLKLHPAILHFLRAMRPGPHARLFTERRVRPLLPLDPAVQAREAKTLLPGFVPLRTARRTA